MAHEIFRVYAVEETSYWNADTLADYGIKAAFGLYLIRQGEITHCCSVESLSWAECIENAFVFKYNDEDLRQAAYDDLAHQNIQEYDSYFGFINVKTTDPRFLGDKIVIDEIKANAFKGGLRSENYHKAIWDAAREVVSTNLGGYEPSIICQERFARTYHQYQDGRIINYLFS